MQSVLTPWVRTLAPAVLATKAMVSRAKVKQLTEY